MMYKHHFLPESFQHLLLVFGVLFLPVWACTQTQDPWEEWSKRQRSWGDFWSDTSKLKGGQLHVLPDSSGFFYFRIDTTLGNLRSEMRQFFRFGPPNEDFLFPPELRNFDQMFERFFRGMPLQPFDHAQPDFPTDDGDKVWEEDDLLPEERLRLQEEQQGGSLPPKERTPPTPRERKDGRQRQKESDEPARKAPDVKTIRI